MTQVLDEFEQLLEESFAKSNSVADIVEASSRPYGRIACVRPVAQNENSPRSSSLASDETLNE